MKQPDPGLRPWLSLLALAASLTACGGGASDPATVEPAAAGPQMRAMMIIAPGSGGGACTPSAPAVGGIDFSQDGRTGDDAPANPVAVGEAVPMTVSFTDDPVDRHTVAWSFGDGGATTVDAVESGGIGAATASHAYVAAGVYTVSAAVADACASATATRQIVVYDPSAGFVTGGGWIQSPAGAYAADPSLTGRANFGFVSKYLKGATVPIGETEFQFQTARLNFHSEAYEWLVVAGARAQYKGTGSINGVAGYRFMLTAVDGNLLAARQADRFRIRIWHADANGADVVDYDNQTDPSTIGGTSEGTAIDGGSIVIHK